MDVVGQDQARSEGRMRHRGWDRDESGFTLVEVMVVLTVIGVLAMMAVPTFLSAKERAMDRGAQSDLQVAMSAAKAEFSEDANYTGLTIAEMQTSEPSLGWVDQATASSSANDFAVSFRVWDAGEINVARLSESGTCFYLRTIDVAGTAPEDSVNVYKGRGVGTCSGNVVAALPTVTMFFGGWEPP
jgi:prepilin-type N-terminal cleavage/methylation domain-containing protein